jgi:hypothetical protein
MENIDTAVLGTIGGDVLKPKIIDAVIAGVKDAMKPANITRETAKRSARSPHWNRRSPSDRSDCVIVNASADAAGGAPNASTSARRTDRRRGITCARAQRSATCGPSNSGTRQAGRVALAVTRQTQDGRQLCARSRRADPFHA